MGIISSALRSPTEVETNFGMKTTYRVQLASNTEPVLLFGTPEQHPGERGPLYLARQLAPDCGCFVDVGTHHGYFTFFVAMGQPPAFPIYFFEANERLLREVEANAKRNRLDAVKGFHMAMGSFDGVAKFYVNRVDDYSSSLKPPFRPGVNVIEIETPITTFASFARQHEVREALIKVDIENAEEEFLQGIAAETDRVRYLIMEVLGPAVERDFVATAMKRLGMEAYYINDFSLEHSRDGSFKYVAPQYNWLFCRLDPATLSLRLVGTRFKVRDQVIAK